MRHYESLSRLSIKASTHRSTIYATIHILYIYIIYARSFIYALGIFLRFGVEFIRKQDAERSLSFSHFVANSISLLHC